MRTPLVCLLFLLLPLGLPAQSKKHTEDMVAAAQAEIYKCEDNLANFTQHVSDNFIYYSSTEREQSAITIKELESELNRAKETLRLLDKDITDQKEVKRRAKLTPDQRAKEDADDETSDDHVVIIGDITWFNPVPTKTMKSTTATF